MNNKDMLETSANDLVVALYSLTGSFDKVKKYEELDVELTTCKSILDCIKKLGEIGVMVIPMEMPKVESGGVDERKPDNDSSSTTND